jgi:uncharacterized peroxidase-related enzyme
MAWIKTIREGETEDDRLRTLYKKYGDPFEGVDNILKIQSLNPESLRHHYDLSKHLMTGKSGLSRMQREMIALVVSTANESHYCVTHHREGLFLLTKNKVLVETIVTDYRKADVGEKDVAMMEFAEDLTIKPQEIKKADVDKLRAVGFKDAEILDIVQVTAHHNFVNRLALGLGVELEPRWDNK